MKQPNQKLDRRPEQTFLQRRHTDSQQAHEKILNITYYQRNTNQSSVRYNLTSVRMVLIKTSTNNKCWRGCGERGTLVCCSWECKLMQPPWEKVWRLLKKLKIGLPYDPATPLLRIHPEKIKTLIRKKYMHSDVYSSIIYNSQDIETT